MAKSAKNGTVTIGGVEVEDVTNITVNKVQELHPYSSNKTGGAKKRIIGHSDNSGEFTILDDDNTLVVQGSRVESVIITSDGAEVLFSGTVVFGDLSYGVNIDAGDQVVVTCPWFADPDAA